MRTLRLQSPRMSGVDVSAWQRFLVKQGLSEEAVDGVFGPHTAEATRAYQARSELTADGVVGVGTLWQAVRDGYEAPAGRAAIPGMDTAADCSSFASCIASAKMRFVVRYYSASAKKRMARPEAVALAKAGLQLAAVYQDSNNDLKFFSEQIGRKHASAALQQAQEIGQPTGSAIYFAVDFDASAEQVRGAIFDYFRAASSALAASSVRYALGVYGSGLTCRLIRDASLATFTWLCGSPGFRESTKFRQEAHLLQVAPSRKICGNKLAIDDDIAQNENFGAFQVA